MVEEEGHSLGAGFPAGVGGRNFGRMAQYVEVEGREMVKEFARFTGIEMNRMVEMV